MRDTLKSYSTSDEERKEFYSLTKRLIDVMVDFSLLTLRSVQNKKQTPLTIEQIEDTVNFDLQFRLQQISDPELLDIVRERATSKFLEDQKNLNVNPNKYMKSNNTENFY